MYARNGVLFNHGVRGGETFVTRKITRGLARVDAGLDECLYVGNLDSLRDWGHARDYVEMQWLMLQQEQPEFRHRDRPPERGCFIELTAQQLGWGAMGGDGTAEVGAVATPVGGCADRPLISARRKLRPSGDQ